MSPKYSIIIVTLNGLEHTVRCLESVVRHSKDCEVIVVDNGSKDGTVGYLKSFVNGTMVNVLEDSRLEETGNGLLSQGDKKIPFKLILNEKNRNFGPGNNQGYELADGKYVVCLNSDTIVTPGWLEKMQMCMDSEPGIAIVGPVSNSSNGRQMVPRIDSVGYDLDAKSVEWSYKYKGHFLEAGVLYGWCLLINREFLNQEEYLFDERFTNSYEDNDLCLRARLRGYKLFIDKSTYIHHVGQGTFQREWAGDFIKKYTENGKVNQDLYFDKWKPKDEQKLVAVYRIANCEQYVAKSLEQTSKFADEIICLLARSQDKTEEIARSFPKVKVVEVWTEPEHPFDEQAERDWLLQKAIERGADWVISVDGDEIYEDKFTEMVPKLVRNPNPQVFGYWCNWRTIWDNVDGQEMYRSDGIFGGFQNYRFFKVLPGMKICENKNIYNHHCGSAPSLPVENLKWLNVRVKHLGYDTPEQRKRKHAFYKKADPRPLAQDVGNEDYHHLIDTNVRLKPYYENNRLTVMSIVKNEEASIYRMLENVEPIADEYLIVDNGSTDGTIAEIERFARLNVKPVRVVTNTDFQKNDKGMLMNYAQAKNFGKSLCRTEWILNMDADELFETQLVTNIFGFLDEPVDGYLFKAINYMEAPRSNRPEDNKFSMSETIRLYRNIDELFYTGLIHESLEDAVTVRAITGKGKCLMSPIHLHHRGYLKDKSIVREKFDRYHEINMRQFGISGEADPRPLFNMALHYMNDGKEVDAIKMYKRAIDLNPEFWRAKQNLAYINLDRAKNLLNDVMKQMPNTYKEGNKVTELVDTLNKFHFGIHKVT